MKEVKRARGRAKGTTSLVTIRDEKINPYYIQKDKYGYSVFMDPINKNSNPTSIGYYSSFGFCLKKIAKEKLNTDKYHYDSIQEYLEYYEKIKVETEKLLNYE